MSRNTSQERVNSEEITYVQISDSLMMEGDADAKWVDDYYAEVYRGMPGYNKPEHYMEIPLWIATISGMARQRYTERLHVVTDVAESAEVLAEIPGVLLFSTIESNTLHTRKLIEKLEHKKILMGGHVDPATYGTYPNVTFLGHPHDLVEHLPGLNTEASPSNMLFEGEAVIPRLTLSRGCLFNCNFCMVDRQLVTLTDEQIWEQVESFKPLEFQLIYLDDKTFGQAPNWSMIKPIADEIRKYNPGFQGFIIQTTTNVAMSDGNHNGAGMQPFKEAGVKYVEIGVESVNSDTIRAMNKPYTARQLEGAIDKAREFDMPLIPNFIFGHPLDTGRYDNFVTWTEANRDVIAAVNVNFLSVLFGAVQSRKKGTLPQPSESTDLDQNAFSKSWLSQQDTDEMLQAVRAVYYTTSGKDFYPNAYSESLTKVDAQSVIAQAIERSGIIIDSEDQKPYWRDKNLDQSNVTAV